VAGIARRRTDDEDDGGGHRDVRWHQVSWVHDTGYGPAFDHEGGATPVTEAGTDPSTPPDQLAPRVIGWRASCQCGWRGAQFHLRSEWRTTDYGVAPEEVQERCKAEWERHVRATLPELTIHDFSRQVAEAQVNLDEAVSRARRLGLSWDVIGKAAGCTARCAKERWSGPTRDRALHGARHDRRSRAHRRLGGAAVRGRVAG